MILVVGSTGQLGNMIARRLVAQGHAVRVLVRPDTDYTELERLGCEPTLGDIKYEDSFGPAFHGVKAVITTASASEPNHINTFEKVDLQGNRNLIDAARAAGIQQFIFVSALGADPEHPHPYFRAKAQSEAYLRLQDMPYTILASASFMEPWLRRFIQRPLQKGSPATIIGQGTFRHSLIAMQDAAAFATAMIDHQDAINKTVAIGGPEALSWLEVVARVEAMIGQDIPVRHYRPGERLPGLSEQTSRIAVNFETFDYVVDMADTTERFGVPLTSLETVASRMLGKLMVQG
jgi:uncharacterized protein YbjT (DUF2867 family)